MSGQDIIIPIIILIASVLVVFFVLPQSKPKPPGPVKPGPVKPGPTDPDAEIIPVPKPEPENPDETVDPVEKPDETVDPVEKPVESIPENPLTPGAPVGVSVQRRFNVPNVAYSSECLAARGVINLDSKGRLVCNKYVTGETIKPAVEITLPLSSQADVITYLTAIYPAYPQPFTLSFQTFYDKLEYKYTTSFKRQLPVTTPVFRNTEFVEIVPPTLSFARLDRATWFGTWYEMGSGSGWFIKTSTCFRCYNVLHGFNLFDLPDDVVRAAIGNTLPQPRTVANEYTQKNVMINNASRRLLAQIALQRGYKCLQISNEWNGATYDRYHVDLLEHIYSLSGIVQKNPFEVLTNDSNENLWLDVFLKPLWVDPKYILDPVPAQTLGARYGDFAFKTGCQKKGGTISIGDMLLNCEKIVRFGLPSQRLDSESVPSTLPRSTELEKLQSYFSVVYGSPEVWKTKDLPTLQDYWKRAEMRYKLSIFPTTPYNTYKSLSFGVAAPGMIAYQEDGRLAEAVRYVEVVRQNIKNNWYDTSTNFSGCYYYPCRGSGLFIPVGKLFIAKTKQVAAKIWGQPIAFGGNPEDVDIAKMAMYKGYQTLMLVRYSGYTSPEAVELIDLRDPITSQMSLIRTHPWDPKINEVVPYKLDDTWGSPPQVDVKVCITTKQYEPGKGLAKCPAWTGIR
jgi:hypothetical protein